MFRFAKAVRHNSDIDAWLYGNPPELYALARECVNVGFFSGAALAGLVNRMIKRSLCYGGKGCVWP